MSPRRGARQLRRQRRLQAARQRPDREPAAGEFHHRADARERAGQKQLLGTVQVLSIERTALAVYPGAGGERSDHPAHDARHPAAVEARGEEPPVPDEEHVAHGARDQRAAAREQERLGNPRIVPLQAREDLLQAVQVLDAGERGILGESQVRDAHAHPIALRGRVFAAPGVAQQQARGLLVAAHAITARARRPAGDDELHDRAPAGGGGGDLGAQLAGLRDRDPEALAALRQALQVQTEETCPALRCRHGLKQPVAVLQSAVEDRHLRGLDAVNPGTLGQTRERTHGRAPRAASRPRALARVSSSSRAGSESATIPAPAWNCTRSPSSVMVRMRMLRSSLPSTVR